MAARFGEMLFERPKDRFTDGANQAHHRRKRGGAFGSGEQQSQTIDEAFGIAAQQSRQHRIERTIRQRHVDQREPTFLSHDAARKHRDVFDVLRGFVEFVEDAFDFGEVTAGEREPRQIFDGGREQTGDARRGLTRQRGHDAAAKVGELLAGPQPLDEIRQVDESDGHGASGFVLFGFDAARKIRDRAARFAAGSFGALGVCRGHQALDITAQDGHRHAPSFGTGKDAGRFARGKGGPESLDAVFDERVFARASALIGAGVQLRYQQTHLGGPHAAGLVFGMDVAHDQRVGQAAKVRTQRIAFARRFERGITREHRLGVRIGGGHLGVHNARRFGRGILQRLVEARCRFG